MLFRSSGWRGAFRECAKLASRSIEGTPDAETEYRLQAWMNKGADSNVLRGARAGYEFGIANKNTDRMKLINDYNFLQEQFNNGI